MNHTPTDIRLHKKSKVLEVSFDDNVFMLPCEYLRVHSPSAEVKGHGPGQEVLQLNKENVNIVAIEPVGKYAVKLIFDDAHNSGLYSWDVLYDLGSNSKVHWNRYLARLNDAEHYRESQPNDRYLS